MRCDVAPAACVNCGAACATGAGVVLPPGIIYIHAVKQIAVTNQQSHQRDEVVILPSLAVDSPNAGNAAIAMAPDRNPMSATQACTWLP